MISSQGLRVLKACAAGVVVAAAGIAALLAERYPAWGPLLVPITTALGSAVAHRFGVPIRAVLEQALQALKPEAKEEVTRRVLQSMPAPMAIRVMESLRPPSIVFEGEEERTRDTVPPPRAASKTRKDGH
jgi:hypothetical protein